MFFDVLIGLTLERLFKPFFKYMFYRHKRETILTTPAFLSICRIVSPESLRPCMSLACG